MPYMYLALVAAQENDLKMAQSAMAAGRPLADGQVAARAVFAWVDATLGNVDDARRERDDLLALRRTGEPVPATLIAFLDAALGESDSALDRLERAFEVREPFLTYLGVDPIWDPLREEERFQELVERLGLPE